MKTLQGVDLFCPPDSVDAICITTNGIRKINGEAVMGKGVALGAAKKWPLLPGILGQALRYHGVKTELLLEVSREGAGSLFILAFPTKNDWRQPSDWHLIQKSASELVKLTDGMNWKSVWLPPPGCGAGGLNWSGVAQGLAPLLNDRFTIVFQTRR